MTEYFTAPRSALTGWTDGENYLARTVYELDEQPTFTGLYDATGNRLYRKSVPRSIGFIRFGATA